MLVYRVFPYLASAPAGSPGHPTYEHPQGKGRVDNPSHYYVWYVGRDATSAVGEVLGNHDIWDDGIFDFPLLPGSKRALGIYRIDDNTPVLNLDHAFALHERGMRPTQVVERNRPATRVGLYGFSTSETTMAIVSGRAFNGGAFTAPTGAQWGYGV